MHSFTWSKRGALRAGTLCLAAAALAATGCLGLPSEFHCDKDTQCVYQQQQGTCEASGYCSFPMESCASGRAYSQFASSALAGNCVDLAGPGPVGDAGPTDAGPGDAGPGDAGHTDAGPADAGPVDAGACGALGEPCCALPDAGSGCDSVLLACGTGGTCQAAACYDYLSSRGNHTCAHRIDGTVWCWGDNSFGELGDGTSNRRTSPVQVLQHAGGQPLVGIEHVMDGAGFSCAHVLATNEVSCWGNNNQGQLGNADPNNAVSYSPVSVLDGPGGAAFQGIKRHRAGGNHTCTVKADDSVWCWGAAGSGQLGHGDRGASGTGSYNYPVQVYLKPNPNGIAFLDAAGVAAGAKHSCGRTNDGGVWCWGDDSQAQLGVALDAGWDSLVPVRVGALPAVDMIEAGDNHTCAHGVGDAGAIYCWGAGGHGQLGTAVDGGSFAPRQVPSLPAPTAQLALGGDHSCARLVDGTVWCWGENTEGELGNRSATDSAAPVQVLLFSDGGALTDATFVTTGVDHTCAVRRDGTVWCWGANTSNQLGAPSLLPDAGLTPVMAALPCGQ